jgi:hypothetical protein
MTNTNKKYIPDETLLEFIKAEQELFISYLDTAYAHGKITMTYYTFALTTTCEAEDWDGVIEHYEDAFRTFIDQGERYDYYRLLERIEEGEQYLASIDPADPSYAKGEELYGQLCEQLQHY